MFKNVPRPGDRKLSVRVPGECVALARELGGGNMSVGVRRALVEAARRRELRGLYDIVEQGGDDVKHMGKQALGARVARGELEAVRQIGGGNTSVGIRIAIREAAQRRGMSRGSGREGVQKFLALGYGGAEVLKAVERAVLPPWRIAEGTGLEEERVEACIGVLEAAGLIAEAEKGYAPTEEGRYVLIVLDVAGRELKALREGKRLQGIMLQHMEIAKHLAVKKADIAEAGQGVAKAAELMKHRIDNLMRLIP